MYAWCTSESNHFTCELPNLCTCILNLIEPSKSTLCLSLHRGGEFMFSTSKKESLLSYNDSKAVTISLQELCDGSTAAYGKQGTKNGMQDNQQRVGWLVTRIRAPCQTSCLWLPTQGSSLQPLNSWTTRFQSPHSPLSQSCASLSWPASIDHKPLDQSLNSGILWTHQEYKAVSYSVQFQ